jgi:DNA-binding transcriptional regulator YhcF (GntR family)
MNEHGDNCYPSIKRICHETGLSNKTVIKYVQVLREQGWLETQKKGFDGQAWAHNQYYPNIPKKVVEELHHVNEGSVTEGERQCISGQKAVYELHTSSTDNSTESSTKDNKGVKKLIPHDFALTDELINYANRKEVVGLEYLQDFTENFINQCRSKGYKYADFNSAWKTWFRKEKNNRGISYDKPSRKLSAIEQVELANKHH